jgi:hypothetical protein
MFIAAGLRADYFTLSIAVVSPSHERYWPLLGWKNTFWRQRAATVQAPLHPHCAGVRTVRWPLLFRFWEF